MTFEEQQDLRILSLLKNAKEDLTSDYFNDLTKNEDGKYIIDMQMKKGFIATDIVYRKDEKTGSRKYWITTLGGNRYDSLVKLKAEEERIEKRNKWNYIFTIIAAFAAVVGIIVTIILYCLS